MSSLFTSWSRRRFLGGATAGTAAIIASYYSVPGAFAQQLTRTPVQIEGPFYPDRLPLDTDNDLLVINESITPAVGDITHLTGRILDARGNPVRNALVEIWQVDNRGSYLHTNGAVSAGRDANFQGFGRFMTASTGEYYFRTVKPVPYPGRTPHIHVKVKVRGRPEFITQCYIRGEPRNAQDGVLQGIRDQAQRESVIIDFAPMPGSTINELAARFDIILGWTPEDPPQDLKDKAKDKMKKKKKDE